MERARETDGSAGEVEGTKAERMLITARGRERERDRWKVFSNV